MNAWCLFDEPTVEEREADQAYAEIEALEKQALDAVEQISSIGQKHRAARRAASASLVHIGTLTTYEVKTVNGKD